MISGPTLPLPALATNEQRPLSLEAIFFREQVTNLWKMMMMQEWKVKLKVKVLLKAKMEEV